MNNDSYYWYISLHLIFTSCYVCDTYCSSHFNFAILKKSRNSRNYSVAKISKVRCKTLLANSFLGSIASCCCSPRLSGRTRPDPRAVEIQPNSLFVWYFFFCCSTQSSKRRHWKASCGTLQWVRHIVTAHKGKNWVMFPRTRTETLATQAIKKEVSG